LVALISTLERSSWAREVRAREMMVSKANKRFFTVFSRF